MKTIQITHTKPRFVITFILFMTAINSFLYSQDADYIELNKNHKDTMTNKMKIEIWSDIACPFCYMGKRKFEIALSQFPDKEFIDVEWKSFQLNPELKTDTSISIYTYLSEIKGYEITQAKQMTGNIVQAGKEVGLDYHFDQIVVANTFKAHCLLHFAKKQGKQTETKERLLNAYISEGRNMDDIPSLISLAEEIGLNTDHLLETLENESNAEEVRFDFYEAGQLGIRSVPFFVFDRKFAVSGAQDPSVFLQSLQKSFAEWRKTNPSASFEVLQGQSCTPEGKCD